MFLPLQVPPIFTRFGLTIVASVCQRSSRRGNQAHRQGQRDHERRRLPVATEEQGRQARVGDQARERSHSVRGRRTSQSAYDELLVTRVLDCKDWVFRRCGGLGRPGGT